MPIDDNPALVTIPSDALRALLNLRDEFPLFRQLLEDIIQIVIVLDVGLDVASGVRCVFRFVRVGHHYGRIPKTLRQILCHVSWHLKQM